MKVTSNIPRPAFDNPDETFRVLANWAKSVGGKAAHIDDYAKATITLKNGIKRAARWSVTGQRWVWADEWMPG